MKEVIQWPHHGPNSTVKTNICMHFNVAKEAYHSICRCTKLQNVCVCFHMLQVKHTCSSIKSSTPRWCTCWFSVSTPAPFTRNLSNAVRLLPQAMQCKTAGTNDISPCALHENLDCDCFHKQALLLLPLLLASETRCRHWREIKHLGHFTALLVIKAALLA